MKLPNIKKSPVTVCLFIILLIASILRFYSIDFGEPFNYHPDEGKLVKQAGNFLNTHFIDIDVYFMTGVYPVLYTLVLAVLMAGFIVVLLLTGRIDGLQNAVMFYEENRFLFILLGRYFVAILGIFSVYLLYRIIKRLYRSPWLALTGAALLAVNFVHVRNSHFNTVDVPATFLVLCSFYYIAGVLEDPSRRNYFLASLFAAAAVAAKYSFFWIALPLVYAHFYHAWQDRVDLKKVFNGRALIAVITSVTGFLLFCPMFILDFQRTFSRLLRVQSFEKVGKIGSGGGFLSYWTGDQSPGFGVFYPNSIPTTLGIMLTVLIITGIVIQLYRHKKQDILLLLFALPMYFYFDHLSYKAMRHILPVIPVLLVSGAVAVMWISEGLFKNPVLKFSAFSGILIGLVISGTVSSWNYMSELKKTDPRTRATQWVEKNVTPGSRFAVESFPPYLPDLFNQDDPDKLYDITRLNLHYKYPAVADSMIDRFQNGDFDYYIADGFTRHIFSWKYTRKKYTGLVGDRYRLFQWLDTEAKVAAEFRPDNEYIQPFVIIYTLKQDHENH